jgi:hypothetical protein
MGAPGMARRARRQFRNPVGPGSALPVEIAPLPAFFASFFLRVLTGTVLLLFYHAPVFAPETNY